MKFGYFTLSDNAYPNNPRTASQFVREIREQAVLAETLGFHSAWVGEHHFDTLGVNSRPDLVLTSVAAVTERIRLAPAVSVLPLHHPIHVAECWATLDVLSEGRVDFACGRGYDSREYEAFNAEFMASAEIFEECMDIIWKAWTSDGSWSHVGARHTIKDMAITPKPVQNPIPFYVASFSETSAEMAAKRGHNIVFAPFAAGMVFGGLGSAVTTYREKCEANGNTPGRAICSYFIHIANSAEEEDRAREAQMSYFKHCVLPAFPNDPDKAPPTMQYFMKIVDILKNMGKEDLTDKSILLGPPAQIIDTLKRVEAAGIDEVILYFNVGNKPHEVVKEQMGRFAEEIAPAFADLGLRTNAG
jgi:alkanesulfonate monooxygenase SsuD/methylene tetrahydromethanopterin reductase-like flavin-dependent oxidoreductase (luciferase family)